LFPDGNDGFAADNADWADARISVVDGTASNPEAMSVQNITAHSHGIQRRKTRGCHSRGENSRGQPEQTFSLFDSGNRLRTA